MKQPIKYPGGLHYFANRLVQMMPIMQTVVHGFAGGLAELFAKPASLYENSQEVINDLDSDVVNFWHHLSDTRLFESFNRRVALLPFSREVFDQQVRVIQQPPGNTEEDRLLRAVAFFVTIRQSNLGDQKQFARVTRNRLRRQMNEQVSAWLGGVEGLVDAHDRLSRCLVENMPAVSLIQRMDGPQTLFVLDPPWLHVRGNLYRHGMDKAAHEELLVTLSRISGKFLLCGRESELYSDFASRNEWRVTTLKAPSAMSTGAEKSAHEMSVWSNFVPPGGPADKKTARKKKSE